MQLVGGIFSIRSLSESPRVVFQICDRGLLLIHRISELTTSDFRRSVAKLKLPDACCFYVRRFHDRLIFVLVRLRSARNIGIFALCASFPRYLCAADVSKHVALFDRGLLAPPPPPPDLTLISKLCTIAISVVGVPILKQGEGGNSTTSADIEVNFGPCGVFFNAP